MREYDNVQLEQRSKCSDWNTDNLFLLSTAVLKKNEYKGSGGLGEKGRD